MTTEIRPVISQDHDKAPIIKFINEIQEAIDTGNADLFNKRFAADILWGSPFAAIASGYDQIHAIHQRMFGAVKAVKGASIYEAEHIRFVNEHVAFAYVRRMAAQTNKNNKTVTPGSFDELALFILVKQNNEWWLAAAQHLPDRRDVYNK